MLGLAGSFATLPVQSKERLEPAVTLGDEHSTICCHLERSIRDLDSGTQGRNDRKVLLDPETLRQAPRVPYGTRQGRE